MIFHWDIEAWAWLPAIAIVLLFGCAVLWPD